ncbi:hypothetical protein JXX18_17985 [Ruthenibacterium lactatiformans]|uniref:hypothetical protein n=1 Tax=Ruthenibacterium lactatiformans TaxID=1550024 RepID=UPI0019683431|nr:hypothetical protein [Ruthenibacterium lactatiformans]MBN3013729.1 hypothetical protein [Ruthenibacterium lactatiformans]MBN3017685.1 hypothetical protein [Ruthenibacterium lactatiformans]
MASAQRIGGNKNGPKAKGTVGYIKISKRSTYKRIGMEPETLLQESVYSLERYQILKGEKEIAQIVKIINTNDAKQMSHCEKPIPLENRDYYVVWDSAQLPVIKCNGKSLLSSWDDVVASHLILASLMQKKSKHF